MSNREIKFRAWHHEGNKMEFSGFPLSLTFWRWVAYDSRDLASLMQFTGLKDKNGVEIYEDDIIQTDSEDGIVTGLVVFSVNEDDDESCWWSGFRLKVIDITDYTDNEPVELRIIGNIYQHPELARAK